MKRILAVLILIGLLAGCAPAAATEPPIATTGADASATATPTLRAATPDRLILATTTSTQDSGLLDALLPLFEQEYNTKVDVIAVGTGQALQIGKDGNADVLLVHARAQEDAFMADGHGAAREDVMYNDFVIVGPKDDPAQISGMTSASEALAKLAAANGIFVSRGDKSGTHTKELALWQAANLTPEGKWYISTGQGMGETLTLATELQGYSLSDRATYLARARNGLDLIVMVEGDPSLFNPYGVITVNPNKGNQINAEMAHKFMEWLVSVPTQQRIADFGRAEYGQSLFTPDSTLWKGQ